MHSFLVNVSNGFVPFFSLSRYSSMAVYMHAMHLLWALFALSYTVLLRTTINDMLFVNLLFGQVILLYEYTANSYKLYIDRVQIDSFVEHIAHVCGQCSCSIEIS